MKSHKNLVNFHSKSLKIRENCHSQISHVTQMVKYEISFAISSFFLKKSCFFRQDYNSDEDTDYEPTELEESEFSSSDYSEESTDQDDETESDSESDSMDE